MKAHDKIPSTPDQLRLSDWIGFCHEYGTELDKEQARINAMPDGTFKQLDMAEHLIVRFYSMTAYFTGVKFEEATRIYRVGEVTRLFEEKFSNLFKLEQPLVLQLGYDWNGSVWSLPPVELGPNDNLTFGEFIDSKVVIQNVKAAEQTKWELLQQIACIFFREPGVPYKQEEVTEGSERMQLMGTLPMSIVLIIAEWFERFNNNLTESFAVFGKSNVKGGRNVSKHFEQWGWINFLISIAKTKIFDLPNSGLNSIECARLAPCYDVLMYASQEKGYNEAVYADMEAERKKHT